MVVLLVVVVVVVVGEVPVGVVIGILLSSVDWVVDRVVTDDDWSSFSSCSSSKPSGGSGILDSQSWSLFPCRNQAGRGGLVVAEVRGTQP